MANLATGEVAVQDLSTGKIWYTTPPAAGEAGELTKLPDSAMMRMFLNPMPINSLPTLLGEGGKKIAQFMVDEYAKLAK